MSSILPRLAATAATLLLAGGLLTALGPSLSTEPATEASAQAAPEPAPEPALLPPLDQAVVTHRIRKGETFGQVMARYGVEDVSAILEAARPHKDLARIRAGRDLLLRFRRGLERADAVGYALDEDRTLWVTLGDTLTAELEEVVYDVATTTRALTIEKTLWQAALDAGLSPSDISRLARIFEYEVDFNTELRAGARLALVVDELSLDGQPVKAGEIHAVSLSNRGETLRYYRFEGEWYAADGTARKRQFLRSPLEFSRVTSGFNPRRFHPIARKVRAHKGTDFGAPTGTPVRATADGVVVTSGRNGGHGLYIKLDHSGPYHTSYSHLSRLLVEKGQRVEQGDVIGHVGSTGASTGPHLHYEFHVRGVAKDAMKAVPDSGTPVPGGKRAAFEAERDRLQAMLDALSPESTDADPPDTEPTEG